MAPSFAAFLYLFIGFVSCSITTDYYQRLIHQEITEARSYQLPKNNEEFKKGIESESTNDYGEFDMVIVGAGAAGCVLATRLSEIEDLTILLIEAGGEENTFNQIPSMWLHHQFSEMNWGYFTTPQKHSCLEMKNRQCLLPRGKVIGGSSSINAVTYSRGNCRDYDDWTTLGNRGWSYEDVLPYFKKSENSQINGDSGYHGKGGFWNVEYSLPSSLLFDNFINASLEMNQSIVDHNGRNQIGTAKLQSNIKRGRRQSLGKAFLDNARQRGNLKVVTKALATKIIIDPETKVAKGVEFVTKTKKFYVRAIIEVIVSAGAFNTPQLLMLSGIGPKNHLESLKIPVIADLPVGRNLIEHPAFNLIIRTNSTVPKANMEKLIELYLNGLGPLTKGAGADGVTFTQTGSSDETARIELIASPLDGVDLSIFQRALNYNSTIAETLSKQIHLQSDFLIYMVLLHEKSRGKISLKSDSPIDHPNIDLNLFEQQEDVDEMVEGVEYLLKLLDTEAFRKINATLLQVPLCTDFKTNSKKYFACLIRHMTATMYHPCGTAAMGPDSKKFVVDDNLQVHGIGSLMVVDASIFPLPVSGHLCAPTVMVAEKGADLIKAKLV